jgi:hypothetical protein
VNFRTTLSTTPKFIRRTPPAEITRDGDGERELPVELPGQAADGRSGLLLAPPPR